MQELHALITKAVDELSQELGRSPSASEIAAELELDVREVSEGLLAKNAYQTLSMDAAMGDDPDDLPLAETLGEEDQSSRTWKVTPPCGRRWRNFRRSNAAC